MDKFDELNPEWRTVKGVDARDVSIVVLSKLRFTFSHPDTFLHKYRSGEIEPGIYEVQRRGELPGSTYVRIDVRD